MGSPINLFFQISGFQIASDVFLFSFKIDNMALYFECRINKKRILRLFFWRFCPLGRKNQLIEEQQKRYHNKTFFGSSVISAGNFYLEQ